MQTLTPAVQQIWVLDEALVSASEATVLRQRLSSEALSGPAQDALRGLSRADAERVYSPRWPGVFQALAGCLGAPPEELPWAAWAAARDGLNPEAGQTWAFLQAGHLHMTPQQVRFLECDSPNDAEWLATLQAGLCEGVGLDIALHRGHSGQLYLRVPGPFDLQALHPARLAEQHLPDVLPSGAHARDWRRASQLACMMTYAWSSERGYPDALWLWGCCTLAPERALTQTPDSAAVQVSSEPAWLDGFRQAWQQVNRCPAPVIHWRPMPKEPALGEDMLACWTRHWSESLHQMGTGVEPKAPRLLVAGLSAHGSVWRFTPRPAATWHLGLGRAPSLADLASMVACPDSDDAAA